MTSLEIVICNSSIEVDFSEISNSARYLEQLEFDLTNMHQNISAVFKALFENGNFHGLLGLKKLKRIDFIVAEPCVKRLKAKLAEFRPCFLRERNSFERIAIHWQCRNSDAHRHTVGD